MRQLARTKKAWFKCQGGPWDGKALLLPVPRLEGSAATLVLIIGTQRGRYIHDKQKQTVRWEPR